MKDQMEDPRSFVVKEYIGKLSGDRYLIVTIEWENVKGAFKMIDEEWVEVDLGPALIDIGGH